MALCLSGRDYKIHSSRKLPAGLVSAARMACQLTLRKAFGRFGIPIVLRS
ncbi:hypothetical protein [Parapedobacter sp. 10938]|nr:hypothetical protein [Parapedobacter sp. 10938]MEC3879703.1 hypothetical protein [Parapedobacter sp. 10938]